jgi:hypothetical protein
MYKCALLVSRICNDATAVQQSIWGWLNKLLSILNKNRVLVYKALGFLVNE